MENFILLITNYITSLIYEFGYIGIVIAMAIESSLIPLPSEIVMIPAGVLAKAGKMNTILAIISGTVGSYLGSLANYLLADYIGRPLIIKHGKYFFLTESKLTKIENFFDKYGSISIFIGRLLPVVRHFISIPAGFAKMNFYLFSLYTIVGSIIWMTILVMFGYFIGDSMGKVDFAMPIIKILILFVVVVAGFLFWKKVKR